MAALHRLSIRCPRGIRGRSLARRLLSKRPMHAAMRDPAPADDWSPDLAEAITAREGIVLGPLHWSVLGSAREHWAITGRAPGLAHLAACAGLAVDQVRALFSPDAEAVILRVAGLPTD